MNTPTIASARTASTPSNRPFGTRVSAGSRTVSVLIGLLPGRFPAKVGTADHRPPGIASQPAGGNPSVL
ncbi:hypothetical protein GCM10009565_55650 [Amycolatopsis albidoflavus]